ncbi:hypothetical protein [Glutamicibacter sp. JC586]|uniref:hypothetical protein n=1 Tax=Glutamicibacter sp. JC586 TaxID=2590552 RepID=UPI0013588793|nr:hypothetical protein [Glutamicibacter sp. JC586]
MHIEFTRRLPWAEIPSELRSLIERALGAAVVQATSHFGGSSPGSADLLELRDGRVVFAKAP